MRSRVMPDDGSAVWRPFPNPEAPAARLIAPYSSLIAQEFP